MNQKKTSTFSSQNISIVFTFLHNYLDAAPTRIKAVCNSFFDISILYVAVLLIFTRFRIRSISPPLNSIMSEFAVLENCRPPSFRSAVLFYADISKTVI